ncbi:MAG: hypothetical protein SF123_10740 [Chloroflexota bacterium]|nr:hypothetical protein [Chloroflexota bacterium]
MGWRKLGHAFMPDTQWEWAAHGYAHLPTPYLITPDTIRVYYAALDANNYGRISFVDLDSHNPLTIRKVMTQPVLEIGALGSFDDCGIVPSCAISIHNQLHLYYIGFQRTVRVPYMLFTGVAIADNNGEHFHRHQLTPLLDRTAAEPYSRSAPWVCYENGVYKMWYWSCLEWTQDNGDVHYNNVIRYATSHDGLNWSVHQHICIAPDFPHEYSIGRPSVRHQRNLYEMWYSVRSLNRPYAIGYARSNDGVEWTRMDADAGITTSASGWDSEMVCYPAVIEVGEQRYLFYNGNGHGKNGFGVAVWEQA